MTARFEDADPEKLAEAIASVNLSMPDYDEDFEIYKTGDYTVEGRETGAVLSGPTSWSLLDDLHDMGFDASLVKNEEA